MEKKKTKYFTYKIHHAQVLDDILNKNIVDKYITKNPSIKNRLQTSDNINQTKYKTQTSKYINKEKDNNQLFTKTVHEYSTRKYHIEKSDYKNYNHLINARSYKSTMNSTLKSFTLNQHKNNDFDFNHNNINVFHDTFHHNSNKSNTQYNEKSQNIISRIQNDYHHKNSNQKIKKKLAKVNNENIETNKLSISNMGIIDLSPVTIHKKTKTKEANQNQKRIKKKINSRTNEIDDNEIHETKNINYNQIPSKILNQKINNKIPIIETESNVSSFASHSFFDRKYESDSYLISPRKDSNQKFVVPNKNFLELNNEKLNKNDETFNHEEELLELSDIDISDFEEVERKILLQNSSSDEMFLDEEELSEGSVMNSSEIDRFVEEECVDERIDQQIIDLIHRCKNDSYSMKLIDENDELDINTYEIFDMADKILAKELCNILYCL